MRNQEHLVQRVLSGTTRTRPKGIRPPHPVHMPKDG